MSLALGSRFRNLGAVFSDVSADFRGSEDSECLKEKRCSMVFPIEPDQSYASPMLVKDYAGFLKNPQVSVDLIVGAVDFAHECHNVHSPAC